MTDTTRVMRYYVSGRVQGVCFRAGAAEAAARLGISGAAVNLADGRVEVLARGSAEALTAFAAWLARGPRRADVTGVEAIAADPSDAPPAGFTTG